MSLFFVALFFFLVVVFTIYRVAESFIKYCIKLLFHLEGVGIMPFSQDVK